MSYFDYKIAEDLVEQNIPFYALIMAAMKKADADNRLLLANAWPQVYMELDKRYSAPGGFIGPEVEAHTRLHCLKCGWNGELGTAYPTKNGCPQCSTKGPTLRYELVGA